MSSTYRAVSDVIETDLGDELILLDPKTQEMFSLNDTGRLVWRALPASAEALVRRVVAVYDVPLEAAEADVRHLLAELLDARLVQVDTAGPQADRVGADGSRG